MARRVLFLVGLLVTFLAVLGLAGCAKPEPLVLTIPWSAGEFSKLEMKVNGASFGSWELGAALEPDGQGWVLTSKLITPQGSDLSTVHAGLANLLPTLLEIDARDPAGNSLGSAKAVYGDGKAVVTARASGQDQPAVEIKLPAPPYFDNEQFVITLRALPLADGWTATLNDITTRIGSKAQIKLEVTGKETVTVPAGTFECWVVSLAAGTSQRAWIAVAEPHQLVQYENAGSAMMAQLVEYRAGN